MNREAYIKELEMNLSSLPEHEREEALSFYKEYFADMEENNPESLSTLELPSQVAAQIKAEAAIRTTTEKNVKDKKGLSTVWIVLLAVFALPVGLPIAVSVAVVAISLLAVAFTVVISLYATALAVVVSGIFSLIAAVVLIPASFPVSVFYLGMGLLSLGLGYILSVGVFILSKQIFIWIARLINSIRLKIKNRQSGKSDVVNNKNEVPSIKPETVDEESNEVPSIKPEPETEDEESEVAK